VEGSPKVLFFNIHPTTFTWCGFGIVGFINMHLAIVSHILFQNVGWEHFELLGFALWGCEVIVFFFHMGNNLSFGHFANGRW